MDSVSWTFKFCSWFVLTNLLQFVKDPNTRLKEELTDKTQVWHSWQAGTHRVDRKWVMNKTGSEQDRNTTSYDEVSIKLQDCDKYIKSWWKWLSWIMKAVIYFHYFHLSQFVCHSKTKHSFQPLTQTCKGQFTSGAAFRNGELLTQCCSTQQPTYIIKTRKRNCKKHVFIPRIWILFRLCGIAHISQLFNHLLSHVGQTVSVPLFFFIKCLWMSYKIKDGWCHTGS